MKRLNDDVIFSLLLIIFGLFYNYQEILFYGPYSNHIWRQADCLSITQNYYEENLNFFTPEVHWTGNKENGKTISEFPVLYYTVAKLWKIFGKHEFIFRLINLLIVFLGLFSLRKLTHEILNDKFWSFFIPLFLFTSPTLIFYTNNFLPNAPAFGLALTGTYLYYQFYITGSRKKLIIAMLIFLLAGLLKLTSLIIFIAILGVLTINGLILIFKNKGSLKSLLNKILPFLLVLVVIAIWYFYARYYNKHHHRNIFLQEIFPIWQLTPEKRKETFELFYKNLIPSFFNKEVLLVIGLLFLFTISVIKKGSARLTSILGITSVGIILYSLLFFRAFHVHDYYLTNLLIFIPLTLITFLYYLRQNHAKIFDSIIIKTFATILLLGITTQSALKNRLKYESKGYLKNCELFISKTERDYWDYYHWSYKNEFKAFETIEPYLRSLGITREQKVLCLSDGSINISLYLMDQKGLTKYGFSYLTDNERIAFAIEHNCQYLIISDKDLNRLDIDKKYLQDEIGKYQNISIFKLI